MNKYTETNRFDHLEFGIGEAIAVLPAAQGGHCQNADRAVAGIVTNRREDNRVFQYLINVVDGGHKLYDEDCVVEVEKTDIFAHTAHDGLNFCTYGAGFDEVEVLDPPKNTLFCALEYIEGQLFQADRADEFLNNLPTEQERTENDIGPVCVGTLYYREGKILAVDIELPEA